MDRQSSLERQVRRAAFGLAMLVVVTLGTVAIMTAIYSMQGNLVASQNAALKILAGNIQTTLNRQIEAMHELSINPLVWTAISDTVGRESYLRPYLRNLNAASAGINNIALFDYRGRPISGETNSSDVVQGNLKSFIESILRSGKPALTVNQDGKVHAWLGFPIVYPYTEDVIGVLFGQIQLHQEFQSHVNTLQAGRGFSISTGEDEIFRSSDGQQQRHDTVSESISFKEFPDLYQFQVRSYAFQSIWQGIVVQLSLLIIAAGSILVWIVWRIAGILAARLTNRLVNLASAVSGLRPSPAAIPVDGSGDEVDQLAATLKRTLSEYETLAGKLELQVEQRTRKLAESEELYRQSFEVNTAVKLIIDPASGVIVDANTAALQFYGYSREQLLSMAMTDIDCQPADQIGTAIELTQPEQHSSLLSQHRLANGEIREVEVYSGPASIGGRQLLHSIIHDVTERRRAETELINAKLAAEAANIAKSRFLATMSHEIRTPMNGILGMAQLLLSDAVSTDERKDYARIILNSGQTLLSLLNDILDLSKVESGKLELEQIAFQPNQLIQEIQILFSESAHQKQIALVANWAGNQQDRFQGDPHRLRQMLSNLVSNALKFTAQGQIEILGREISREGATATLELSVADSGPGVSAEKQLLLFQPFSQVDSSTTRQFGGTGLGLSIVRSLARIMGGEVGLESTEGQGSRFWFRVQVTALAAGQDARGTARSQFDPAIASASSASLSGHVLVVEDNATNRKVVEVLLDKIGLSTTTAVDGQQGLALVKSDPRINLILMDIRMPVMDGYEATRTIREWEREMGKPPLPVIALTADAFEDDRQHALNAGMDDFLTKPISMKALQSVLMQWLRQKDASCDTLTPSRTIDVDRINVILKELLPLLAANRFDAISLFNDLRAEVSGTLVSEALAVIGNHLEQLNFSACLAQLRQVAQQEGWRAPS